MIIKNLNIYFFLFLLIVGTVAGFLLIKPFLSAIFIAALFAVMLHAPYETLAQKIKSRGIASALMLCIVAFLIILPLISISGLIVNEVSRVITESTVEKSTMNQSVTRIVDTFTHLPVVGIAFDQMANFSQQTENVTNVIKNVANASIGLIQKTYYGVLNGIIGFFVMFFTLFYFFIDGKKIMRYMMDMSPLRNSYEQKLINEFISMTRATLKGTVVIGFVQGIIAGTAFAFAGVVSPVLWTVVMIILSIIPAVGPALVIFPVAIVMLLLGHVWQGIFLIGIGFFVSMIDNLLRPKLVGRDTQMHSLAVFFATIGGLKLFGFIGFIIGPIIMALMLAMWKIYATEFRKDLDIFNA